MSNEERTGFRSLIYSGWHRPSSTKRYLGVRGAALLTMIDVDSCEACALCSEPLALIETAHTRREPKAAPITALLARLAHIPAFSVSYYGTIERSRCEACNRGTETGEIEVFLVRQIQPPDKWVNLMTPDEYAKFLLSLRAEHTCALRQVA